MKKIILLTTMIFSLSILLMPAFIFAQDISQIDALKKSLDETAGPEGAGIVKKGGQATNLSSLLGTTINYVMGLIGSVFLAYTITGGVLWIMAGGSEDKVTRAKKFITGGITGMLVIFLAYTMVYFVVAALDFAAKGTT